MILGFAILVGVVLVVRGLLEAEPAAMARRLRQFATAGVVLLVLFLVMTGRFVLALPLLGFLPVWARIRSGLSRTAGLSGGGPAGSDPGRHSQVDTAFLRMRLDHSSGVMAGDIIAGPFAGQAVDALSPEAMVAFHAECRSDPPSLAVLEAWLDRYRPGWRVRVDDDHPASVRTVMTREEALAILGLAADADEAAVKAAYHRLMRRLHPDQGGSTYLAAKINEARDLLLHR
ncbi:MAG: hypothetical protein P4M00_19285 [Azospirillaceae bacterium]|nr:hypothetical protein [Azospirillaceae bacterium]